MLLSALCNDGVVSDIMDLQLDIRVPPVTGSRVNVQDILEAIPFRGSATTTFEAFLDFFSSDPEVRLSALKNANTLVAETSEEKADREAAIVESLPQSPTDNRWFDRLDSALVDTPPREGRLRPRSGTRFLMSQSPAVAIAQWPSS